MSGRRWGVFVVWAVAGGMLGWGVLTLDAHVLTVVGLVLLAMAILLTMRTPHAAHTLLGVIAGGAVALLYALWGVANSEGDSAGATWPNATYLGLMLVGGGNRHRAVRRPRATNSTTTVTPAAATSEPSDALSHVGDG